MTYFMSRTINKHEGGLFLKRSYSSHDIEKAVELAQARGLDDFMRQHPHEKRHATLKNTRWKRHKDFNGEDIKVEAPRKSIFDVMMFGSPQLTDHSDSPKEQLVSSSMSKNEMNRLEDDLSTCDPCEEVREIVNGIRAGKYKLRTTALLGDTETGRTHHHKVKRLKHPEHWSTVSKKRKLAEKKEELQDSFKYHRAYWDDGNMWVLKMSNKK
jgi:hypothetical protein